LECTPACAKLTSNCSTRSIVKAGSASEFLECTVATSVGSSVSISLVAEVASHFSFVFVVQHGEHAVTRFLRRNNGEVIHGREEFGATRIGTLHLLAAALNGLKHVFLRLLLAFCLLLLYTVRGTSLSFSFLGHTPFPLARASFIITLIFFRAFSGFKSRRVSSRFPLTRRSRLHQFLLLFSLLLLLDLARVEKHPRVRASGLMGQAGFSSTNEQLLRLSLILSILSQLHRLLLNRLLLCK